MSECENLCWFSFLLDVNQLKISGNTTVKKGDTLNLTCSVDSFPASLITWTKSGCTDSLCEEKENEPLTQDGPASLIIHNMTAVL